MRYYITFVMLLVLSYTASAQGNALLSIGEKGNKYAVTQPVKERMSPSVMRENAKLYVSAGPGNDNTYMIVQYDISVLSDGKIIGPFTVKHNDEQKVFDKLHTWFETGAKVFYDKIMLICRECTPPEPINARPIMVTLE